MKKIIFLTGCYLALTLQIASAQISAYRMTGYQYYQYSTSKTDAIDSTRYYWLGGRGKSIRTLDQYFADSVVTFSRSSATAPAERLFTYHNTFNANNKTTNHVRRTNLIAGYFGDQFKVDFIYDGNNNEIQRTYRFFNTATTQFDTTAVIYYEYNASSKLIKETYKTATNGITSNYSLKTYSYDASGNLINFLEQRWASNTWTDYSRDTYTYTAQNLVATRTNERYTSGNWNIQNRYSYTYNSAGVQTLNLIEGWTGSSWFNNMRFRNTVDGNNRITENIQEYYSLSGKWVPNTKRIYQYDASGNRISDLQLTFVITVQPDSGEFAYDKETTNVYDANNNIIKTYAIELSGWVPVITLRDTTLRYEYQYEQYNNTTLISPNNELTIDIYPNPTHANVLYIKNNKPSSYFIMNYEGKIILEGVLINQDLDISSLPSGYYLIQMDNKTAKFIKY